MNINMSDAERLCVHKASMDPLLSLLLIRGLACGDTALHRTFAGERLRERLGVEEEDQAIEHEARLCMERSTLEVIAFPRWASLERSIAEEVAKRVMHPTRDVQNVDIEGVNEGQRIAIRHALASSFFVLTGGPGTGKTYTAGKFLKAKHELVQRQMKVLLLAPTGKAVKTLEKAIRKSCKEDQIALEAMTLHAYIYRRKHSASNQFDVILIDEASMIDTELLYQFFHLVHESIPLFFMGDADQLPPVEPGQPFADIVHVFEEMKLPHVQRLTVCERTDSTEILECARAVLANEPIEFARFGNEVCFVHAQSSSEWRAAEEKWQERIFHPWTDRGLTQKEALVLSKARILLTPERRGPIGSEKLIQRADYNFGVRHMLFAPLLVTKNMYDLQVMNGDIGVLHRRDDVCDTALFSEVQLPLVLLEGWEFAYSVTVHKSQGSEFDEVHLVLPPYAKLSRKLLYTALTRARSRVVVYGSEATFARACACSEERMTSLPIFLKRILICSI